MEESLKQKIISRLPKYIIKDANCIFEGDTLVIRESTTLGHPLVVIKIAINRDENHYSCQFLERDEFSELFTTTRWLSNISSRRFESLVFCIFNILLDELGGIIKIPNTRRDWVIRATKAVHANVAVLLDENFKLTSEIQVGGYLMTVEKFAEEYSHACIRR